MVRRLVVLCSWLGLAACGGPAPGAHGLQLSLVLDSAAGPVDTFRVRIFGAAVKCADVLAAPATFELGSDAVCTPAEADTSSSCLLAFQAFNGDNTDLPVNEISPGSRTVFVEGLSGSSVTVHGCSAVQVLAGESSSATVTLK